MSTVREVLGQRLKKEREKNNLTQEEFGKKFNLNKQYISYYEKGKREPGIDLIVSFAKELKVSVDYLLGNSDYRTTQEEQLANKDILSAEAISKLLELVPDLRNFFLNCLMCNDKFYDLANTLLYVSTFPREKLDKLESSFSKGMDRVPEKDYLLLKEKWLKSYVSSASSDLFNDLFMKKEE